MGLQGLREVKELGSCGDGHGGDYAHDGRD